MAAKKSKNKCEICGKPLEKSDGQSFVTYCFECYRDFVRNDTSLLNIEVEKDGN